MVSRSFAWIDDEVEHSDADYARATALAKKWSELKTVEENRYFNRLADEENGHWHELDVCEECEACLNEDFSNCDQVKAHNQYMAERQAERDLEIELVEDKLLAIGARMMRPYEHWNEDERYMEYMENREDY